MEADNKNQVAESLLNQGFFVVSLEQVVASGQDIKFSLGFNRVSTRDLVVFTRQLSTMMAAGLSILRCFNILVEQTVNRRLNKAVAAIRDEIESGQSLWESMAQHPAIFSPVYISMIKAGEMGGVMDAVLQRLGDHLEREQEINSKIKSASVYPAVISVFAIAMVFFIITFVMPTFVTMFQSSGVELPLPTRILLNVGLFLQHYVLLVLAGIALIIAGLKQWGKTPQGRMLFDGFYLRLPLIGNALARITVARFSRTMGTLVRSGIPVLQALEVVEDVVGNAVIARAIHQARLGITEGETISGPLRETGVFEPMVTQMIAVGEETGALDDMLIRMSDYFEREVMYMIDGMMSVIEPVMILVVAVVVGSVVVATLLPVFDMVNLVGG